MSSELPSYVAVARPVPQSSRGAWYKNTAPTYAGIMLWFVFWQDVPVGSGIDPTAGQFARFAGGTLAHGLGLALLALVIAALICHFLFYVVPGMLGMKTGLPLYILGTSTYGVTGGFIMPGFLMGVLQFGWLGVNAFFSALLLCQPFGYGPLTVPHAVVASVWALGAAFMGLKGIQYVAKVASLFPLIPLVILVVLLVSAAGGIGSFDSQALVAASKAKTITLSGGATASALPALPAWGIVALMCTYIVGFFATAGAAGADFGMNNRDGKDVQLGGLVGIAGATIFAGGVALLTVAGLQGLHKVPDLAVLRATDLMGIAVGTGTAKVMMYLLAIAAFPPACFSAFIAANSFKTTLPKVNPYVSVGIGTAVSIFLAVTGWAGNVVGVFQIIGASFGPICGAMAADYLLAGKQWAGPRAGFNPAGWISWAVGFVVGAADFIPGLKGNIPAPPVAAFVVGFVLYLILAKLGLESRKLAMPAMSNEQ
jgi:cytosine permease